MNRQYDNRGRDQINIEQVQGNVVLQGRELPTRPREELLLLQTVEDEVVSRLEQSLHHAVLINLAKEAQPEQVNRPWERELRIGLKPAAPIPTDQTIAQVFDDPAIKGKLLILGQPGAGKTTALLDLAKVLVERAGTDINQPIPIVLNLSTWRDEKQLIRDWVIAELKSKYGISLKLAEQWLKDRKLLPLLDGLDEVAPERQESCIIRINEFLSAESSPLYVTVCSRLAEYENLTTRLQLHGAVCLKELSNAQIQVYLGQLDRPLLWQMLCHNLDLLDLVRAPLLLSITLLAFTQDSEDQWQQLQRASDPLQFLLDAYIERMLHRQFESRAYGKRKPPTARETRGWLIWLAHQMEMRSQTEFLIEELQPSMLSKQQGQLYRLVVGLRGGLIVGLGVGLLFGVRGGLRIELINELIAGLIVGLSGGLISGLFLGLLFGAFARLRSGLFFEVFFGLLGGLFFGTFFWVFGGLIGGLIDGPIGGLLFGLGIGLFFGLFDGPSGDVKPVETLKWSWRRSLPSGLLFGLIGGLGGGLLDGLSGGLTDSLIDGLLVGLFFGLFFGLSRGLVKETVELKISPNQGIKRSAQNAVIVGLGVGLLVELIVGLSVGLLGELFVGLSVGVFFSLIAGLIVGLLVGGEVCLKHFVLRILLYQNKQIPWNYARFLNYCTECLFLQRVGGRYRFIHKYLQDYFAAIPLNSSRHIQPH